MSTPALLVPLVVGLALITAAVARLIYRESTRGRHRLLLRTRVRVYLGRRAP